MVLDDATRQKVLADPNVARWLKECIACGQESAIKEDVLQGLIRSMETGWGRGDC